MNRSLWKKGLIISFLSIALLVLIQLIRGVVEERQSNLAHVTAEIIESSVDSQKVVGPILAIPYRRHYFEEVVHEKTGRKTQVERTEDGWIHLLPSDLAIESSAETEKRYRGIYSVLLYRSKNQLTGSFSVPTKFPGLDSDSRYVWGEAKLVIGIDDPRGIKGAILARWNGEKYQFTGGTEGTWLAKGVTADLGKIAAGQEYRFAVNFDLLGLKSLAFAPIGKQTRVTIQSNWPHPSFFGQFLPDVRSVGAAGFNASWQSGHLATNMDQLLHQCELQSNSAECNRFSERVMGTAFIQPIDIYAQTDRSLKYALLFITITFGIFALFELLKRLAIHPIQYMLVGIALALFFLLLTALSEHISFLCAYLIAASACLTLVGAYVGFVLHSARRALGFATFLGMLYAALYALLQSEDLALLLGAGLLFVILGVVMMLTRRVNWYALGEVVPK